MKARGWTCWRVTNGAACKHHNPPRTRKCAACGKPRPSKRIPTHARTLTELDYARFIALNGGEHCAICHRLPTTRRRLDRDHCHSTGQARGLLCARCNRALPAWATAGWLRAAAAYLERTAA